MEKENKNGYDLFLKSLGLKRGKRGDGKRPYIFTPSFRNPYRIEPLEWTEEVFSSPTSTRRGLSMGMYAKQRMSLILVGDLDAIPSSIHHEYEGFEVLCSDLRNVLRVNRYETKYSQLRGIVSLATYNKAVNLLDVFYTKHWEATRYRKIPWFGFNASRALQAKTPSTEDLDDAKNVVDYFLSSGSPAFRLLCAQMLLQMWPHKSTEKYIKKFDLE